MSKSRVFLYLLIAFIAGVALRSLFAVPFFFIFLGFAAGAVLAVLGIIQKKKEVALYSLFLLAFAGGVLRFEQVESAPPDLSPLYGRELEIRGIVAEDPEVTSKVQRLTVRVEEAGAERLDRPFLTLATLGLYPRYLLGDELAIRGTLEEPQNFTKDFDYRTYLSKGDIYSTFFFPQIEKIGENRAGLLALALSRIKNSFEEKIELALPEPHAAFLKGLTLGERESLPEELVESFNRTGVTHIIALSGYNITLVSRFFIGILLALTLPFSFAFWIAASGVGLFVLLTGASPSVVRAGIMGILLLLAQREGRLYHIRNALVFAGAIMIFQNPKILRFDAAFQLSFLATLGLIYLSPQVERWYDRLRSYVAFKAGRVVFIDPAGREKARQSLFPVRRTLVETMGAQIMVLPLLIFLFGRVSLVSPATNLLVILSVPYSMILGFLAGALGFLWEPLSQAVGWLAWILLEYKIRVIEFFARSPYASVELGQWAVIPVMLIYIRVWYKIWKSFEKTAK